MCTRQIFEYVEKVIRTSCFGICSENFKSCSWIVNRTSKYFLPYSWTTYFWTILLTSLFPMDFFGSKHIFGWSFSAILLRLWVLLEIQTNQEMLLVLRPPSTRCKQTLVRHVPTKFATYTLEIRYCWRTPHQQMYWPISRRKFQLWR